MTLRIKNSTFEISSQIVRYFDRVYGFLSMPKKEGKYPGIVIVHGNWGLDEYIKEKCEEISSYGYVVLAVDLFSGQVTQDPQRSQKILKKLSPQEAKINILAALAYLQEEFQIEKIAAICFSFGVGTLIRSDVLNDLKGFVIFHGQIDVVDIEKIKCPTIFIYGEADESVTMDYISELKKNFLKLNIENEVYLYFGANKDFDNKNNANFLPQESEDAWEKVFAFLKRNLQKYKKVKIKVRSK